MSATKIINILKNDDFDDVFGMFKSTEANEVIFIFPKNSKLKQEKYFRAIKEESLASDKKISIMTGDPAIAELATQFDFELLEDKTAKSKKESPVRLVSSQEDETAEVPVRTSVSSPIDAEADEGDSSPVGLFFSEDNDIPEETDEPVVSPASVGSVEAASVDNGIDAELPEVVLAVASSKARNEMLASRGRSIRDIIRNEEPERMIKIDQASKKEEIFEVDIKNRIQQSEQKRNEIVKMWAERGQDKKSGNLLQDQTQKIKSSKVFKRTPIFLIAGAILVLAFVLYSTLGSAQVLIHPQKQNVDLRVKVSASTTTSSLDSDLNRIPGQKFSTEKEETVTVPATGQKNVAQKASGTITIYNKTLSAQLLVATTRFQSESGLIYRIAQTVIVPAGVKSGSTITPGSIVATVFADKAGPEYNISPTKFSLPGLQGTSKFNDFYASSVKLMTGGVSGLTKIVTDADYSKAQDELTAKVKSEVISALKGQPGDFKILDSTPIKLDAPVVNAKAGEAADSLQMTIRGSSNTVAFREADIMELIRKYISKNGSMDLLQKDLSISYEGAALSQDGTSISFYIKVGGQAIFKLDGKKMRSDIAGMNENSVKEYFRNIKEVESARITLSPFWVKSIPRQADKIQINIENN